MTTTHTHVFAWYANPYLRCNDCKEKVTGYISFDKNPPECEHKGQNVPCGHKAGIDSVCASWSPVIGCRCEEVFGRVDHSMEVENEQIVNE